MKYPRAAMIHKFLFMMLVQLSPYTRGTLSFLSISHEMFRLLMDIVRDEHNIPLYNEMRSYALDYQGIIDREHTNYDIISILYYSKYRHIKDDRNIVDVIIKKMRLDNGLLRN